jgi:MoaA/NifB/PqqE/SkfB family radical SAM enzyme
MDSDEFATMNQQKIAGENQIYFAIEAVECSNCCRHCETTFAPRRNHMRLEEVARWAEFMHQQMARTGVTVNLTLNNSELLDHPQWRELRELLGEIEPIRSLATNGRRLAREPELFEELKTLGLQWIQLVLVGGTVEKHDWLTRRPGSFTDIIRAGENAVAAGVHIDWGYLAFRPLSEIMHAFEVAKRISGPVDAEAFAHKGGIDQSIVLIKPQGAGIEMEHLRPSKHDLQELPEWMQARFASSFGAACETEAELVEALTCDNRKIGCIEQGFTICGGCGYVVSRNGDVYPYCHERTEAYRLGNLYDDGGFEKIIAKINGENPPLGMVIRQRGLAELAEKYGDRSSDKLHSGCSLCRTLVKRTIPQESKPV